MSKTYPIVTVCHRTDHISVECVQDDKDDAYEIAEDHANTICENKNNNTDNNHYVTKSLIHNCSWCVWQVTGTDTGIKLFTVKAVEADHNI